MRRRGATLKKNKEIRIRAIDLEKIIAFLSVIAEAIKGNEKFRAVLEHDPENLMSVIEIFKES